MAEVLVASQNMIKALATEDGFNRYNDDEYVFKLAEYEINSGVSDQPTSLAETAQGAINRLDAIRNLGGYAFYVSIEGGLYSVDTPYGTRWYETACAALVDDDTTQIPSVAFGPGYPVRPELMQLIEKGMDLNQAMEAVTGIKEIGKSVGFNGWLTDNKFDRRAASALAVYLALEGFKRV